MFLLAQEVVNNNVLFLDVQLLNFLAGFVIPLLVGLLTKLHAPSNLKAVLNLALSAIAGAITTAIAASGEVVLAEWLTGMAMTWFTSIVSYYGLWKPTHTAPAIQRATRGFGIGSARRSTN